MKWVLVGIPDFEVLKRRSLMGKDKLLEIDESIFQVSPYAKRPDLVIFLRFASLIEASLDNTNELIEAVDSEISKLQNTKMPAEPKKETVKKTHYCSSFAKMVALIGVTTILIGAFIIDPPRCNPEYILIYPLLLVFYCAIYAAIGAAIGAAVGALIGYAIDTIANSKAETIAKNRYDEEHGSYNRDLYAKRKAIDKDIKVYRDELNNLIEIRTVIEDIRRYLYESEVLYEKYQNLPAVFKLLEYFEAGRFETLGDAYNQYEVEERLDKIIRQLDIIIECLSSIYKNQIMIFQKLADIESDIQSLCATMNSCCEYLDSSQAAQKITAIATSLTALSGFMVCGIERKQLRNMPSGRDVDRINAKLEYLNRKLS